MLVGWVLYMGNLRMLGPCCLDGPACGPSLASEAGEVASRILLAIWFSSPGSMGGFSSSEDSSVSCILSPKGVLGWFLELMLETGLGSPGAREAGG